MMQKCRICAGAVKVLSAKLLMGISWSAPARGRLSGGLLVRQGYLGAVAGTYLDRFAPGRPCLCCEYGVWREIAVEDVSAVRGEPGVQRRSAARPARAELADRTAGTAAGRQDHGERHRRGRAATIPRDHRGAAGDQRQLP